MTDREERDAIEAAAREMRAMRGRWLVVYEGGGAIRCRRKSKARKMAREARDLGVPALVMGYHRANVSFDDAMPGLEVIDVNRWPR